MIETPYLLFLGDAPDMLAAKVATASATGAPTMPSASCACRAAAPTWG